MSRPVQTSQSVTAGAGGVGSVTFRGPGVTYEQIDVSAIQLSSTSDLAAVAKLYRGGSSAGLLMAVELDGITGAFVGGDESDRLIGTDEWTVEWTNATPGASCSAVLTGTQRRTQ